MSYEFQSMLYQTSAQLHAAIADAYLTAGGLNGDDDIWRYFAEQTDEQLADDAIAEWELTDNHDFDRAELLVALKEARGKAVQS